MVGRGRACPNDGLNKVLDGCVLRFVAKQEMRKLNLPIEENDKCVLGRQVGVERWTMWKSDGAYITSS
jgi:hypothetical protein